MPELTRRRSTDAREECWHVYYGDVQAGTIAIRSGNPMKIRGSGIAVSIRAVIGRTLGRNRRQLRRGPRRFEAAWKVFWRSEPRLTFRRGMASKTGPLENMRCGKRAKTTIAETKYADEVRMRPRFIQWRQKSTSTPGP
jgi:hypothetical protein